MCNCIHGFTNQEKPYEQAFFKIEENHLEVEIWLDNGDVLELGELPIAFCPFCGDELNKEY